MDIDKSKLVSIFTDFPSVLNDRIKFVGILRDYFPTQKLSCNAIIMAYDLDIVTEIRNNDLNEYFVSRFVRKMVNEYGIQNQLAQDSVVLWCESFGKTLLKKDFEYRASSVYDGRQKTENGNGGVVGVGNNKNYNTTQQSYSNVQSINNKKYYNGYDWKFTQALFTFDKKLKEDCGTTYDDCDDSIVSVLGDIYAFDQKRAIADWDWLLKTFPAKILNSSKGDSYGMPFSCRLGVCVLSRLFNREDYKLLAEYVKQDYVFDYLVLQSLWEKHDQFYLSELLCCYTDSEDLFKKCYETVLSIKKDCYSKKDLGEVWGYFLHYIEWGEVSETLKKYIVSEIEKVGDFGKPVLKTIEEEEEELEERKRWEEEKRLEAEQEAAEEEECRLEEEREAAERAEHEQQIKILEDTCRPLSSKIFIGEYYDETYKSIDQQFKYCFGTSRRNRYNVVAKYVLEKNGEIKNINKEIQVGVISSKDIENIFMLVSTGCDISHYYRIQYGLDKVEFESERQRLEINKPIIEYLCKYCYSVRLIQLATYGESKKIYSYQNFELRRAKTAYDHCLANATGAAKEIFDNITKRADVSENPSDDKRLFLYAQLNYPDAVYKYTPGWSEGLQFSIFISSLNLIIEYRKEFKNKNALDVSEWQKKEMEKANRRRLYCEARGIKYAEWYSSMEINEANFIKFIKNIVET